MQQSVALVTGNFVEILRSRCAQAILGPTTEAVAVNNLNATAAFLQQRVHVFVFGERLDDDSDYDSDVEVPAGESTAPLQRAFQVVALAAALLNLYVQVSSKAVFSYISLNSRAGRSDGSRN